MPKLIETNALPQPFKTPASRKIIPDLVSRTKSGRGYLGSPVSDYYPVYLDPKSLNPNHSVTSHIEYHKTKDLLAKHLNSVSLGDHIKNIISPDSDNMIIAAHDHSTALSISTALNTVLPKATDKFHTMSDTTAHNALVGSKNYI